tara:strand:+ start:15376 stop:16191 length:816 start_codon:yes stop_codon:yes gene_type:complete
MHSNLEELWQKLWQQYASLNPNVLDIKSAVEAHTGKEAPNDHVAFRTFRHPSLGIDHLAKTFTDLGYRAKGEYHFEQKKLYAQHFEHESDPSQPKVFVSELKLEECSKDLQDWVNGLLENVSKTKLEIPEICYSGRPWPAPNWIDYQNFYKESEYAAWLSVFGFCANHFTVFINELDPLNTVEAMNEFLEKKGYTLNASGGKVKGTPDDKLEQSSTMAHQLDVEFADGSTHTIPTVYYEFAKRYKLNSDQLYQGFVASSADKIFESTNAST